MARTPYMRDPDNTIVAVIAWRGLAREPAQSVLQITIKLSVNQLRITDVFGERM
jgi:hypothetical protein